MNSDYQKKYLKYKGKYLSMKESNSDVLQNNQKGGEAHYTIIRKDGNAISYPNGFPNLQTNGDYHIIHAYDETLEANRMMTAKLEQLNTWVTQTFNHELPQQGDNIINKAGNIWQSDQKQNFINLVNWLNDPTNN